MWGRIDESRQADDEPLLSGDESAAGATNPLSKEIKKR
jgi:hypothetical protein